MRWILLALVVAVGALALLPLLRGGDSAEVSTTPAVVVDDAGPIAPKRTKKTRRPPDAIAGELTTVILDIANGKTSEDEQAALRRRIVSTLEAEGIGDEATRRDAAEVAVRTIVERAQKASAAGRPMGDMKVRAVKALARDFAREMRRRLPAGSGKGKHDPNALRAMAPEPDVPAGYQKASWKLLAGFEYSQGMKLPKEVTDLHGKKVGVGGYMIVLEEKKEGISEFLLVQSLWDCCFGLPPELHQGIVVRTDEPGLRLTTEPILVLGTIEAGEDVDKAGSVLSIYRMQAERIESM